MIYLRGITDDRQASPLETRPGALVEMQRHSRQTVGVTFMPKSDRKRLNGQLDTELRGSNKWTEYFTKEREPPTSVFNILVEHTLLVFELEKMASTQLAR